MSDVKQVILVRKDLKMKPGKMAAQAAHASSKVFMDRLVASPTISVKEKDSHVYMILLSPEEIDWRAGIYRKACLAVNSEEELRGYIDAAKAQRLPTSLIEDIGLTCFNEPTVTCGAIGPATDELIDEIVGHLKLY